MVLNTNDSEDALYYGTAFVSGNINITGPTDQLVINADVSSDDDTVFVYDDSSPYYENIVINKSISLIGEDKNTTVIDAYGFQSGVKILVDDVTIGGFTIQNSGQDYAGINFVWSENTTVIGNTLQKNDWGIWYRYYYSPNAGGHAFISKNTIIDNRVGISTYLTKNNTISYNRFEKNKVAVGLTHGGYNQLYNNNFLDNSFAVHIYCCDNNKVYLNNFNNNSLALDFEYSYYNEISMNNFIGKRLIHLWCGLEGFTDIWDKNYWKTPRVLPKLIVGIRVILLVPPDPYIPGSGWAIPIPWATFDWHPAQEPYDIGVRK